MAEIIWPRPQQAEDGLMQPCTSDTMSMLRSCLNQTGSTCSRSINSCMATVIAPLIRSIVIYRCVAVDGDDHERTSHRHINLWRGLDVAQEPQGWKQAGKQAGRGHTSLGQEIRTSDDLITQFKTKKKRIRKGKGGQPSDSWPHSSRSNKAKMWATYSSNLSPGQHKLGLRQYTLLDGGRMSTRVFRLRLTEVKTRGGTWVFQQPEMSMLNVAVCWVAFPFKCVS